MMLPEEQEVKPELTIEPPYIEFGTGSRSFFKLNRPDLLLTVRNTGSGVLTGRIKPQVSWLSITPDEFSCQAGESSEHHILIHKEARFYWDARGHYLNNLFLVISNAGSNKVNGSYKADRKSPIRSAISWLMVTIGMLMIIALVIIGLYTINWKTPRPASTISVDLLYTQGAATEIARMALTPSSSPLPSPTILITPSPAHSTTPLATPSATPWPRDHYPNPEQFIKDYYQLINNKQYDSAWKMLSPDFRQSCCVIAGNDAFEVYKTFWTPITRVDVTSAYLQKWDVNPAEVYVKLKYTYKDGKNEEAPMVFYIIDDASQKTLLINVVTPLK